MLVTITCCTYVYFCSFFSLSIDTNSVHNMVCSCQRIDCFNIHNMYFSFVFVALFHMFLVIKDLVVVISFTSYTNLLLPLTCERVPDSPWSTTRKGGPFLVVKVAWFPLFIAIGAKGPDWERWREAEHLNLSMWMLVQRFCLESFRCSRNNHDRYGPFLCMG